MSRTALGASGAPRPRIVVDLSRVTFMDPTGINIFAPPTAPSPTPAAEYVWPQPAKP
ncbi:hypothetical protein ACIP39_29090 [Streptomyces tibetensis]|uniref:hypothetical protein n=1 Tax=Streptomyces tibetensis TaxID=2382123 RepID=UPI003820B778